MNRRLMIEYAKSLLGIPYIWGGNSVIGGLDCSGFVVECLRAVGVLHSHEDFTARELLKVLLLRGARKTHPLIEEGGVLFFGGAKGLITHTAIALNGNIMIEAGGGGNATLTIEKAAENNACVRIRPIRSDLIDCLMPNYENV